MNKADDARMQMREEERRVQARAFAERERGRAESPVKDSKTWMEAALAQLEKAREQRRETPEPAEALMSAPLMRDDLGRVVTEEIARAACSQKHIDAVRQWMGGRSVLIVDQMRQGKTMAARYAFNVLIEERRQPAWATEEQIMLKVRERVRWYPSRWQVIDNCFSAATYLGFSSKSDESIDAALRYRDQVVNYLRDRRGMIALLATARRTPTDCTEMDEDLRARWCEMFDDIVVL